MRFQVTVIRFRVYQQNQSAVRISFNRRYRIMSLMLGNFDFILVNSL